MTDYNSQNLIPRKKDWIDEIAEETIQEQYGSSLAVWAMQVLDDAQVRFTAESREKFATGQVSPQEFEQLLAENELTQEDYQEFIATAYRKVRKGVVVGALGVGSGALGIASAIVAVILYAVGMMSLAAGLGIFAVVLGMGWVAFWLWANS